MALDPRYILQQDLESYFVDRLSGLPLANGVVTFYEDDNRNTLKGIFELSGAPPNYTYTPLPNPMTLSAVGTPQDVNGNNIAIYYFPYDNMGNAQLYYVTVQDQFGNFQFTREAWPNSPIGGISPATAGQNTPVNMLTNPQFADVFFNPAGATFTIAGVTDIPIAPGWNLLANGAGTINVVRNSVPGTQADITNPAYTLTLTPGAGITSLQLYQRLFNDPNIWSQINGTIPANGWVASSVSYGNNASAVRIDYVPNGAPSQNLLTSINLTGTFVTANNTVQLTTPMNASTADNGYVDIVLTFNTTSPTTLSSIQVIGIDTNTPNVPYDQSPVNRQIDYTFHYYKPLLAYKPIPSWLVGWDFPMNPAQINGSGNIATVYNTGANSTFYAWDQTLVFQSLTNSISYSRAANNGLALKAVLAGSTAIIQYLEAPMANELLSDFLSVHMNATTTHLGGLAGKVTLWYTTNAMLPNAATGTNLSVVTALDATGFPTVPGGWVQVPRSSLGDATFTLNAASATSTIANDINLNMWNLNSIANANGATYFAIVIGLAPLSLNDIVTFNTIGLCSGNIATRPAPKSISETLLDCQRYFYSSFPKGAVPAQNFGLNTGYPTWSLGSASGTAKSPYTIVTPTIMSLQASTTAPTLTLYNPVVANASVRDFTAANDCATATGNITQKAATISVANTGGAAGDAIGVHFTMDARLGIVL